ncbi:MAG TPA: hypothetical protein VK806_03370 [Bacteroidia bacterium]|jgi:hypothetical protein|nr:hypothetical protein [Bacteroidia bacterium]
MKTKHLILTGILAVSLAGVIITGCKKESTADTDATAAQDDANATFAIQDTKNSADGAAKGQATERPDHSYTCATWTWDSSATTDTLIISYPGTCVSPDGRTRKGDIIVYWPRGEGYFTNGSVITMTFKNYSFTNLGGTVISVTGTRSLTNTGKDSLGDYSWNFNANLTLNYSTGGSATWNSSRTNTLMQSGNFYYYSITGSASGTSKSGVGYTITISSPLIYAANWINYALYKTLPCYCIEAGQLTYTRTGKTYPLYLTYTSGLGKCNNTASATINGNTYNIYL